MFSIEFQRSWRVARKLPIALLGLLAFAAPALATGDLHQRAVQGVSLKCDGHELLEQVFEGGSVMESWAKYRLLCITDGSYDRASWIISADVACGGDDPGECSSTRQVKAFNQIKAMSNHASKAGSISLKLERAMLSKDCIRRRGIFHCADEWLQKPGYEVQVRARAKMKTQINAEAFMDVADNQQFLLDFRR